MNSISALVEDKKINFKLKKEWRDSPTTISHTDFSKIDLSGIGFSDKIEIRGTPNLKKSDCIDTFQSESDPMLEINRKMHNFNYSYDAIANDVIDLGDNESIVGTLTLDLHDKTTLNVELGNYKLLDLVIVVNCEEGSDCKLGVFSANSGITYLRFKKNVGNGAKLELINSHLRDRFLFLYGDCNLSENSNLESKIYSYSDSGAHYDCIQNADLGFNSKAHVIGHGIIDGPSSLIFRGALRLHSDKANGNFETKTLNISKGGAFTDSIPILDISAHDVLAKHSSSIESIDKEDIFYIMTRGFSEKEASKLILDSFISSEPLKAAV